MAPLRIFNAELKLGCELWLYFLVLQSFSVSVLEHAALHTAATMGRILRALCLYVFSGWTMTGM